VIKHAMPFASLQTLDGPKEFGGCQENITSLNCMVPSLKFSGARITFGGRCLGNSNAGESSDALQR